VNDWWEGLIVVALGLGILWSARGAAEVNAEMVDWRRSLVPRSRWWWYAPWKVPVPVGTWIGRGIGIAVVLAGAALIVSGDLFGLL
jgi:hypothetical protein